MSKQSPQSSTDAVKESLSALMDSQATEMDVHRVLKASETDSEVRSTWSRYHIASAAMRQETPAQPQIDLSMAIRSAIDSEENHAPAKPGWMQSAAKMAVAASVAAVMVVTTQFVSLDSSDSEAQLAAIPEQSAQQPSTAPAPVVSLPSQFQAPIVPARTVSSHSRMPVSEAKPQNRYYPVVTKAKSASSSQPPSPEVQAYLREVMEIHAGNSALNSGRGLMPYARVPVAPTTEP
ncbi:sigma-E factor negative regulatory protein [Pseudomaricurvus alkylphenolicus]|uniref:sigma-E factor negative regulatory protein n=1 Tax=Pseudomaricurvus alkylphenolicus TaxID=1306991 RepID=UPI001421DBA0|nr:sigma-E factor negative regulatory protein [Pseudomaricurvus alkylphenolicus]NIB43315.1 sigma-E factor negative regulatory protein [Pseudomaricurvus alkylphenolicus]